MTARGPLSVVAGGPGCADGAFSEAAIAPLHAAIEASMAIIAIAVTAPFRPLMLSSSLQSQP
jgi:hypothetical protein